MNGEKKEQKDNFEIAARLCEHHMVIDLCEIIGRHAFMYLINIWMWLTRHGFHDGVFPEIINTGDIELIAKWDGKPNKLAAALLETGWIMWSRETNSLVMKGITYESLGDFLFCKED